MKTSRKTALLSLIAFVTTYLLAWWSNAPAITSTSNATVLGLVCSALFCITWWAVTVLYRKKKAVLWLSFLLTVFPLLLLAINVIGLDRYLNLYGISYFCAIITYTPYLGFALAGEIAITLLLIVQCVLFFALLVHDCKKAWLAPVVIVALWLGLTYRIPLDMLAPVPNHINAMSIIVDDVNQEEWVTVDVTDRALGEAIYQALQDTTVRYIAPSDAITYGDDDCILTLRLGGDDMDLTNDGAVYIDNQKFTSTNGTALYELLLETAEKNQSED